MPDPLQRLEQAATKLNILGMDEETRIELRPTHVSSLLGRRHAQDEDSMLPVLMILLRTIKSSARVVDNEWVSTVAKACRG